MISTKHLEDYPNGFSIALAFEYGVGIVGQTNPVPNAWEYNLKDYNKTFLQRTRPLQKFD